MPDKLKNWEELCNDGENYGNEGENLSPKEKILFEKSKKFKRRFGSSKFTNNLDEIDDSDEE